MKTKLPRDPIDFILGDQLDALKNVRLSSLEHVNREVERIELDDSVWVRSTPEGRKGAFDKKTKQKEQAQPSGPARVDDDVDEDWVE